MIKFKKYTWDVKFIVFLESGDPTIPIWVEVFGKGGKNSPSNLVSLGKIQVYHGQFVGILGVFVSKLVIKAVGANQGLAALAFGRNPGARAIYDPHFKTWGGKWFDYMGEGLTTTWICLAA